MEERIEEKCKCPDKKIFLDNYFDAIEPLIPYLIIISPTPEFHDDTYFKHTICFLQVLDWGSAIRSYGIGNLCQGECKSNNATIAIHLDYTK